MGGAIQNDWGAVRERVKGESEKLLLAKFSFIF